MTQLVTVLTTLSNIVVTSRREVHRLQAYLLAMTYYYRT